MRDDPVLRDLCPTSGRRHEQVYVSAYPSKGVFALHEVHRQRILVRALLLPVELHAVDGVNR